MRDQLDRATWQASNATTTTTGQRFSKAGSSFMLALYTVVVKTRDRVYCGLQRAKGRQCCHLDLANAAVDRIFSNRSGPLEILVHDSAWHHKKLLFGYLLPANNHRRAPVEMSRADVTPRVAGWQETAKRKCEVPAGAAR